MKNRNGISAVGSLPTGISETFRERLSIPPEISIQGCQLSGRRPS